MRLLFGFLIFIAAVGCLSANPVDTTIVGKTKNGLKTGQWVYYDAQHHILKIEKYRKGKMIKTLVFNQDGKAIQRINRKGVVTKLRACGC